MGLWALYRLATLVFVLTAAALFAYVIAPLVQWVERPVCVAGRPRRIPRGAAIVLVYALLAVTVVTGGVLLLPSATTQINDFMTRAPAYSQSVLTWEHHWTRYYERVRIPVELRRSIDRTVLEAGQSAFESARGSLLALVGALASDLPWLVVIPVLAFFFLKDTSRFRRTIVLALPHRIRLRGHRLFEDLNATLAAYVRAQLLACVVVGSLCGLGFAALGMWYPALLGLLAGLLEFIPLVGPALLAAIAAVLAALHTPWLTFQVIGFLGVLRVLEDYVIYPRLIRRQIRLHPLIVIVAVLTGAELHGIVGLFLAVPAAAVVSVACRHWLGWRRDGGVVDPARPDTPARTAA